MELKNIFLKGKMNKDFDERLVPKGEYIHAENIQVIKSEGSDIGAVENILGNKKLTDIDYGPNAECIGGLADESDESLYWCVKSDRASFIMEWRHETSEVSVVLEDSRPEGENVLNFSRDHLITGINLIVDSDSGKRFLLITDDLNDPRNINIERAKQYGPNNFRKEEINLIKRPPLFAPEIKAIDQVEDEENNLRDKFVSFSYRYRYVDGEYSALGPFTPFAFHPTDFEFDFTTASNESMVNAIREVELSFNTGDKLVTDVELVFKESGSNNVYYVESFNKEKEGWGDDEIQKTVFANNKVTKILPEDELYRLYDNVPLRAKAQEIIGNRLVFGNYVENYDLIDSQGNPVNVDLKLSKVSTPVKDEKATKTVKANRDYEAGVTYLDDYGRMTTVLTGGDNTVHIPIEDSVNKNQLKLEINNQPPDFAKYYRVFLKQSKDTYETVVVTNVHHDGIYVWLKMNPTDINKFKEGDYLIVKADTSGPLDGYVETRVIEVKDQPRNFLESSDKASTMQTAGMYYKLKPERFDLSKDNFSRYECLSHSDSSREHIYYSSTYVEEPSYYGFRGLDDLTVHGTYTNPDFDYRYIVHIDSTKNVEFDEALGVDVYYDTFKWSRDGGNTWYENIRITGEEQDLQFGIKIKFANLSGHEKYDNWVIPAKGAKANGIGSDDSKAYLVIAGDHEEDTIYGGAEIGLKVYESGESSVSYEEQFISTRRYDNIEEWFYGDGIDKKVDGEFHKYWFRRGDPIIDVDGNTTGININSQSELRLPTEKPSLKNRVCMIIESTGTQNNILDGRAKIFGVFSVVQSDSKLLFETKEKKINSDVYFEQSVTYPIVNGMHSGVQKAVHDLPFFNAFCWGNAFESYKIKDDINERSLGIDSRPSGVIKDYRQNKRIASLTYSGVYEQSTNYNALNEFNLSLANYKDLDDKFGSIQKLHSKDSNLLALQEDKVIQIMFGKSVVYNADGTSSIQKSNEVLGEGVPYSGEFGIGKNPESFVSYATWMSWTDSLRGKIVKLGGNGLFPFSKQGMSSWFRNVVLPKGKRYLGSYDPYFDKVLYSLGDGYTAAYDEEAEGWTTLFTYEPEWMLRLGNRLFSLKDGQLYIHNDKTVPRNNFYGVQHNSKLKFAVNDAPSDIKVWKAIGIEGNTPWDTTIDTFQSGTDNPKSSTITKAEYIKKEGYWYSHVRRNEVTDDFTAKSNYGIGLVTDRLGFTLTCPSTSTAITAGDKLYTEDDKYLGIIQRVDGEVITMDKPVVNVIGKFIYGTKDVRIEGSEMRGYTSIITLENDSSDKVELYAVNSQVFKSHR